MNQSIHTIEQHMDTDWNYDSAEDMAIDSATAVACAHFWYEYGFAQSKMSWRI